MKSCYTIYESYVNLQVNITPIVLTTFRAWSAGARARFACVRLLKPSIIVSCLILLCVPCVGLCVREFIINKLEPTFIGKYSLFLFMRSGCLTTGRQPERFNVSPRYSMLYV